MGATIRAHLRRLWSVVGRLYFSNPAAVNLATATSVSSVVPGGKGARMPPQRRPRASKMCLWSARWRPSWSVARMKSSVSCCRGWPQPDRRGKMHRIGRPTLRGKRWRCRTLRRSAPACKPRRSSASLPHATWNFPPFKPKKLDSVARSPELSLMPTTFGQRAITASAHDACHVVAGACRQIVEEHGRVGRGVGDPAEVLDERLLRHVRSSTA